ncbi:MAG TPA: hypothetical protein PK765_03125 [bacterium]|nr:hypothetical protein [bacterium]
MAILKPESFKTSEVPDSSAILSAAVKNEEISRDQRITPLVIHP